MRLWAGPVISQELALPPRPLPEGWVGFPVYLLCNSCVFNRESLLLASPRGRTALQLPFLSTRLPPAVGQGCVRTRLGGARPCAVGGHRGGAGLGRAWTTSGTGPGGWEAWGVNVSTRSPCKAWPSLRREPRGSAHARRKEMKRGSKTGTKRMKKSQGGEDRGITGQRLTLEKRGYHVCCQPSFQSSGRLASQTVVNK